MGKLIFITGGARSGKSTFAVNLARTIKKKKVFIATCLPGDGEMKKRVALHRKGRPSSWKTVEPGKPLPEIFKKEAAREAVLILDCLTLFVASLLMKKYTARGIRQELDKALREIKKGKAEVIIVSNEVGSGLVPENKLGRDFRDIAGSCNQRAAASADEVFCLVAGIPLKIKGEKT
ncbi:MAG: bifunctional adenosylcobinamide kinase/adenosylcobinamide-phosphate guanylyltransferase [Candidatus Omnitrophica bacterium]|jgi:adenosylcobinamide kinase/adenosylcobinamide-phosphate guanylyltransferase|nr:bifunctional adenosylcobinamide kinase/adenosylcobinamide-phosphate guanylyltransferase [Candidatus Omnitrophota bacterium]MDD5724773.1 bifunctional adenosylcobinamide kinase/adenosylcobinamide-phosphate guanylyltransferase [Candidatus Omnitrophota bacterium]